MKEGPFSLKHSPLSQARSIEMSPLALWVGSLDEEAPQAAAHMWGDCGVGMWEM